MAAQDTRSQSMSIDEQLKIFQLKDLQRRLAREEEEEKIQAEKDAKRLEAAKREIEDAKLQAMQREYNQERCPHSSKGISFVRGQRLGMTKDEKGNPVNGFLAFCQICLKSYKSREEIPEHLRSDESFFGGPTNY